MKNKKLLRYIPPICMLIIILVSGFSLNQMPILMLPLCLSVFIMLFQSEANRYGYLVGSFNCLLYGFADGYVGLYATAASDVLLFFPIQLFTFLNWNKHPDGNTVIFKKLTTKQRLFTATAFIAAGIIQYIILTAIGSNYAILDNVVSLLGILVAVLTLFAYIEYSYIWIISTTLSAVLRFRVLLNDVSQLSFFIMAIYNVCYVTIAFINVRKNYLRQQIEQLNA